MEDRRKGFRDQSEETQVLLDEVAHGRISRRIFLARLAAIGVVGTSFLAATINQVVAAGENQITQHRNLEQPFDYIIVGGGGAGCVVARRLAENSGARILLIEAGPSDAGINSISQPHIWFTNLGGPYDWGMKYAPQVALNGREISIARGKILGGCGSINAMLWVRGHPDDYNSWAEEGCAGWDFQSILPTFKSIEDWEGGATAMRGSNGPLRCELPNPVHPVARALLEASKSLGYQIQDDVNGPEFGGASLANLNIKDGARDSTARAYLRPILHHSNVTVLTGQQVDQLVLENGKVTGVRCLVKGELKTFTAESEVIVTAGALHTPQLLMRSGIGAADDLKSLGILPQVDLPGVGQNLQDHPLLMGVNLAYHDTPLPLSGNGGGAQLIAPSGIADNHPDLMIVPIQIPYANKHVTDQYGVPQNSFAITPGLMRVKSRGYLKLRSADPAIPMEIQPNILQETQDREALERGVELCLEICAQQAIQNLGKTVSPKPGLNKAELSEFVSKSCSTFFHPVGTCKMGRDGGSVVDPANLKVYGIEGLRVMDASVIPTIPTCNTHAPVVMIAERGADMIRKGFK